MLEAVEDAIDGINWHEEVELLGRWYPLRHAVALAGLLALGCALAVYCVLVPLVVWLLGLVVAGVWTTTAWAAGLGRAVVALNVLTFGVFVLDKVRARQHAWRVPELTLLKLCVAGGWPGALVAMLLVQHKTRKVSFLVPVAACVAVNTSSLLMVSVAVRYMWHGASLL